ncbi:hypothetical protein TeGR_g8192, partial [Tetraparma gracilis]
GMHMGMGKTMSESYSMGMGKTMSESYSSMGKRTSKGKTSKTPKSAPEDPVDSDPSLPPPPQAPTPAPPTECTTTVELNVDCTALDDANINDAVALWLSDQSSAMARYGPISDWATGNVTNMYELFRDTDTFNEDVGGWDVSRVTNMRRMFYNATAFNQTIGSWDVSKVADMGGTFEGASKFNQDISSWDVSIVTDMYALFNSSWAFAQDLSPWCVELIPDEPDYFGNGGGEDPIWGACPCNTTNAANGDCEDLDNESIKLAVKGYLDWDYDTRIETFNKYGPMNRW